ncbi:hypothetical protein ACFW88_03340 [Streptomyces anandii]|uniref:Uncharacterized protein n=1 Tax=Streptomyces anandii TaxID=285454 RepID=A0ABW6GZ05_9ACTN
MLKRIDTDLVIREGGAVGVYPGQIHEGVAWWLGACLVVTQEADAVVVAHNGHAVVFEFASRLCRGAINAQHFACTVYALGVQTRNQLLDVRKDCAAWLEAHEDKGATVVRIQLFDRHGVLLDESTGLAEIRRLIGEDRVPLPVNDRARGRIVSRQDPLAEGVRR